MNLVEKKQAIDSLVELLLQNKKNIQDWLIKYVNTKKNKEMLDSFYFQTKLMDAEYELVEKIYKMIENRMYGEYYKLWLVMSHYTKDWKDPIKFPPYKDLEPTKQYDSKVTQTIGEEIVSLFTLIREVMDKLQKDIDLHKEELHNGIHIENYINTLSYQLGLMNDQVKLFQDMFDSYQRYHHQRYDHFIKKIELLNSQIEGTVFPMCEKMLTIKTNVCQLCNIREPVYCKECANVIEMVPLVDAFEDASEAQEVKETKTPVPIDEPSDVNLIVI